MLYNGLYCQCRWLAVENEWSWNTAPLMTNTTNARLAWFLTISRVVEYCGGAFASLSSLYCAELNSLGFLFLAYHFLCFFHKFFNAAVIFPILLVNSSSKAGLTLWWIPSKQTYLLFSEICHQVLFLMVSMSLVLTLIVNRRDCMLPPDDQLVSETWFHCAPLSHHDEWTAVL